MKSIYIVIYMCNMYIYIIFFIYFLAILLLYVLCMYICLFFSFEFYFPFDLNEYFGWVLPGYTHIVASCSLPHQYISRESKGEREERSEKIQKKKRVWCLLCEKLFFITTYFTITL